MEQSDIAGERDRRFTVDVLDADGVVRRRRRRPGESIDIRRPLLRGRPARRKRSGFRFPDGSVQISAASGGALFPSSYGLLSRSPYASENFIANPEPLRSAVDFADWTPRAPLPVALRSFNLVALDRRLYALGGFGAGDELYL